MATTNMRIVIRRDTSDKWAENGGPTLLRGEIGYETDTGKMKFGDNLTNWVGLPYFAGGITDIDGTTIISDANGQISLNVSAVIGDSITGSVQDYVDAKDAILSQAITDETTARIAADSSLSADIAAEAATRLEEDTKLSDRLNAQGVSLQDSVDALEAVDATLADSIEAVDAYSKSQDATLESEIQNLRTYVESADQAVTEEAEDSIEALDTAIRADLQDSVTALEAADVALATAFADSITALEANDHPSVSDINDSIKAGDDSVTAAYIAADLVITTDLADSVAALESADAAVAGDLTDSVAALEAADADIKATADAAAPNDVGGGYAGVISSNGTVNAALAELEVELNTKYAASDDPTFGTVTGSSFVGPLKGSIFAEDGIGVALTNGATSGDAVFTGSVTGNVTGTVSDLSNHDADALSDGATNKFYTETAFNNSLSGKTADDLPEGSTNTYYTDDKVRSAVSAGGDLSYNAGTGQFTFDKSSVTAGDVGLDQVNNTSDADKPVSTAQQAAIDAIDASSLGLDTNDDVTFNTVTADLIGDVTGTVSDISNHSAGDLRTALGIKSGSDAGAAGAATGELYFNTGSSTYVVAP